MKLWLNPLWCRDGRPLTDDEIAGMLIGLLLAGQHTSSTTSAWLGFFIARDKAIQEQCYAEQKAVCGDDLPPLTYEQVCMLHHFWWMLLCFWICIFKNGQYGHRMTCIRIITFTSSLRWHYLAVCLLLFLWSYFSDCYHFFFNQHLLWKLHFLQAQFKKWVA